MFENAQIESEWGTEAEGWASEGDHLELWVENPDIGDPSFRYFIPKGDDPIADYASHVARDETDEVTRTVEIVPGEEWVLEVSTYAGWERIWAKWRTE